MHVPQRINIRLVIVSVVNAYIFEAFLYNLVLVTLSFHQGTLL